MQLDQYYLSTILTPYYVTTFDNEANNLIYPALPSLHGTPVNRKQGFLMFYDLA